MALTCGTKLGPYEILSPLGAGGMGEVYRARDGRLERDVAVKILPESFAADGERLRRFEQEARAVAALNHPNIVAIHDIGAQGGVPYIVSELLEGESLRAALERGALPLRKTIEYGVQIAHGLAAAHEKGIVHRDLKPENIFVTRDGRAKILDFGLAKLAQSQSNTQTPDELTLATLHTQAGVVMGTASYMAPEQVRGKAVDARSDIFAFGAVLYEMLSGTRAFGRDTAAETMTAVLKEDPSELSGPVRAVSSTLDRIVRRCLEKNPEERFQSARDLGFALGALSGSDTSLRSRPLTEDAGGRTRLFPWAAAALAMVAVAVATWFVARRPEPTGRMQFSLPGSDELSISHMSISPDGSTLALVSPEDSTGLPVIYVQRIGSPSARVLPGTQGASFPFWSPDGAYVGFFAHAKLQKIAVGGGMPQVLATAMASRGGNWGKQNVIIYSPDPASPIWRVNADGSDATPLTQEMLTANPRQQTHRWPVFLPDGKHFLYWAGNFSNSKDDKISGIYLQSLDDKQQKLILLCHSSFGYDSGHLYYADDQKQLVSITFDPANGQVSGNSTPITGAVGYQPSTYWAALAVASNGTVIYNTGVGAALSQLTWEDRAGKELGHIGEPAILANPSLSPDGSRVSLDIADLKASNVDIWIENTNGSDNSRFTFDPAEETNPVWSRDGSTIAYRSIGTKLTDDSAEILVKPVSGLEKGKGILRSGGATDDILPNSWSADGQLFLSTDQGPSRSYLVTARAGSGQAKVPLFNSKSNETNGQISSDGRWVAYASDESGVWEIYVSSFPGASGKWQVSRGGGSEPRWRADGKEIFYISPSGMLMAVPVSNDNSFSSGTPAPLFQIHGRASISSTDVFTYDVAKDGRRFLVNRYVKPDHVPPLTILLHAAAAPQ
jgi:Tol biopolymer transport system component